MAALAKRYEWLDFNEMSAHMHMSDVHFFDQEVPYIDQDFTIKPDFRLLHRLEGANRLKRLQTEEDTKTMRLLTFGFWVTQGRTTRVATEGKISTVWTMVIAGDQNGTASFGFGKGVDMLIAEKRAVQDLKRNMLFVPMFESRTISHEIEGVHGVCKVRMWPRPRNRGLTAGIIPRMLFECFGLKDITAKIDGRALAHHQCLAIFNGLREVKSLREEAIRRGVTAHRMFERGLSKPRHPGRAALHKRGLEVDMLLREVRATKIQEELLEDISIAKGDQRAELKKRTYYYPSIDNFPEDESKSTPDNVYFPPYIVRKPEPIDVGRHSPAPKLPINKKPAISEILNKRLGLPHVRTPMSFKTNKVM